jgi:hypothetical protein
MSKKHFIALANAIREHNCCNGPKFDTGQIETLADFCKSQNPEFKRERWLAYIAGECGKNGGAK